MKPIKQSSLTSSQAGLLFLVTYMLLFVAQLVVTLVCEGDLMLHLTGVLNGVVMTSAVLIGTRVMGAPVRSVFGSKPRPHVAHLGLAAALTLFAVLFSLPIMQGIGQLFSLLGYNPPSPYADYYSSVPKMLLALLTMAFLPAIGEEILVRGSLFGGLRAKGTVFAGVFSALVFALMHGGPTQFFHQLLLGLLFAFLYHMTGSLLVSIVAHFVNNVIAILHDFLLYQFAPHDFVYPVWAFVLMAVVGFVGLVLILFFYMRRVWKKSPEAADGGEAAPKISERLQVVLNHRGEYVPYDRQAPLGFGWVAGIFMIVVWLVNTITGWIS